MIGYIIGVTLTGIITGMSMGVILGADGFLERTVAFILGFLVHVVLALGLTVIVYQVIEMLGVIL